MKKESVVAERFIKTLKNNASQCMTCKYMTSVSKYIYIYIYIYIDKLDDIVN